MSLYNPTQEVIDKAEELKAKLRQEEVFYFPMPVVDEKDFEELKQRLDTKLRLMSLIEASLQPLQSEK